MMSAPPVTSMHCSLLVAAATAGFVILSLPGTSSGRTEATCFGSHATIVGNAKSNTLRGTPRADVIVALGGNDKIFGLGGNDKICAGSGNDKIYGGGGNDRIDAGPGNDTVFADDSEHRQSNDAVIGSTGDE